MEAWLNHRLVRDWKLLLEEFLIVDWIVVSICGLSVGFTIAWAFSRVSKQRRQQFKKDSDSLRNKLELFEKLKAEQSTQEEEIEKLKAKIDELGVSAPKGPEKTVVPPAPIPEPEPEKPKQPEKKKTTGKKPDEDLGELFKAADRVVFALDVSMSMESQPRKFFARCKEKLEAGVADLSKLDQKKKPTYQVIFFSGPTWFAHQKVTKYLGGKTVVVKDSNGSTTWHRTGQNEYEYRPGIERLPVGEWREATDKNIKETINKIKKLRVSRGTTWHRPLQMAMTLDPPPSRIDFLTDGKTANAEQVALGIVKMVNEKSNGTVINTFGVGKGASDPLRFIAEETGGVYHDLNAPAYEQQELPGI